MCQQLRLNSVAIPVAFFFFLTAMLAAKDDAETPNVTRHATVDQGVLASRQIDGGHGLALLTSAVRAIRWNQNLSNTSIKGECIVGPTKSVSSEMPLENWAEVSKTTLTLVVVIWSVQRKVDVSLGSFWMMIELDEIRGEIAGLHNFYVEYALPPAPKKTSRCLNQEPSQMIILSTLLHAYPHNTCVWEKQVEAARACLFRRRAWSHRIHQQKQGQAYTTAWLEK